MTVQICPSPFSLPIASWRRRVADAGETPETRSFCYFSFCSFFLSYIHLYVCVSFSRCTSVSLNHQSERLMPCLDIVNGRVCSTPSSSAWKNWQKEVVTVEMKENTYRWSRTDTNRCETRGTLHLFWIDESVGFNRWEIRKEKAQRGEREKKDFTVKTIPSHLLFTWLHLITLLVVTLERGELLHRFFPPACCSARKQRRRRKK